MFSFLYALSVWSMQFYDTKVEQLGDNLREPLHRAGLGCPVHNMKQYIINAPPKRSFED